MEINMEFNPEIHTKKYLIENPDIATNLAENSISFREHSLTQDLDILNIQNAHGWTVAHLIVLATPQNTWLNSEAAKNPGVLKIRHRLTGTTVAHLLSKEYPNWMWSDSAKRMDILQLRDSNGKTVAHILAESNALFSSIEDFRKFDVLNLKDNKGNSVAYYALKNEGTLDYQEFFHKSVLGIEHQFKRAFKADVLQLAELITVLHENFNASKLAMILITQGAAYKQSNVFEFPEFDTAILNKTKSLIDDSLEPEMALKYAMAFYSTCYHANQNIKAKAMSQPSHSIFIDQRNWQDMQDQAKDLIETVLLDHPKLYDTHHEPDLNCEPAMDVIAHFASKKNFANIMDAEPPEASDETIRTQSLY
jgi:hypothetical protein